MKMKTTFARPAFWTVFAFYSLIALEFFYMASPFAAYFYAVYGPQLTIFQHYPSLAWIGGFFLPHITVATRSPVIDALWPIGAVLASVGFAVFVVCAFCVYYAKLVRKGLLVGGIYRIVRHPQYAALALCGFGLLLLWPRFLNLAAFVCMLFAYYWLARMEERECVRIYGEGYEKYKAATPMFIPFVKLPSPAFGLRGWKAFAGQTMLFAAVLTASLTSARLIRAYSVGELFHIVGEDYVAVSLVGMDESDLRRVVALAMAEPSMNRILIEARYDPHSRFVTYIVPEGFYVSEIPMNEPPNASCHPGRKPDAGSAFVVVLAKAVGTRGDERGRAILDAATGLYGLAEVNVDLKSCHVATVTKAPSKLRYGGLPEPTF